MLMPVSVVQSHQLQILAQVKHLGPKKPRLWFLSQTLVLETDNTCSCHGEGFDSFILLGPTSVVGSDVSSWVRGQ